MKTAASLIFQCRKCGTAMHVPGGCIDPKCTDHVCPPAAARPRPTARKRRP